MNAVFDLKGAGIRQASQSVPRRRPRSTREASPGLLLHFGREGHDVGGEAFLLHVHDAAGLDPDAAEDAMGTAPEGDGFSVSLWQEPVERPAISAWDALDNLRCVPGDRRRAGGSSATMDVAEDASHPVRHMVDVSSGARRWGMGRRNGVLRDPGDGSRYYFHIGDGVDILEEPEGMEAVNFGYGIFMDAPEVSALADSESQTLWTGAGSSDVSADALGAQAGVWPLRFAGGANCRCAAPRAMVIRESERMPGPRQS